MTTKEPHSDNARGYERMYRQRRQRLLASYVAGSSVLDIGHRDAPNPHLFRYHPVGYDRIAPDPRIDEYSEEIAGTAETIGDVLSGRRFDTIVFGELIEHIETPYAF